MSALSFTVGMIIGIIVGIFLAIRAFLKAFEEFNLYQQTYKVKKGRITNA